MCQSSSSVSSGVVSVCILANGISSRFGGDKLSFPLDSNTSLLEKTLSSWDAHPEISEVYIVGNQKKLEKNIKNSNGKYKKFSGYIEGGNTRYESFCAGIDFISGKNKDTPEKNIQKILFHNAANPFVTPQEISAVIANILPDTAVGVGRKATNTLRRWNRKNQVFERIPREEVYAMETPQGGFLLDFIHWKNQQNLKKNTLEITDELMLAEENSGKISILPADPENIKITYKSDVSENSHNLSQNMNTKFPITGFGTDSHRFSPEYNPNEPCMLCGVVIEKSPKFSGNSDADVAIHALCNALLSAIGGDSFSGIATPLCEQGEKNSLVYIQKILETLKKKRKKILHVVLSVEGKRPKIEKYFPKFREKIGEMLSLSPENIGLNATTGEEIDGYGKGEGMKVSAVVTVL